MRMIGSAMRRYAHKHGLTCSGGWAYGRLGGCLVILDEGWGWKRLRIYLYPPARVDESRDAQILRALGNCDRRALQRMAKAGRARQRLLSRIK